MPLKDGVVFKGKMRFHNLKKAELGALLSALTFHNTPKTFHNIGMAKSLGYGKVELKLDGVNDIDSYLKEFEFSIGEQISNWASSEPLKELLSMATEQNNEGNSKLKYMELKEFANNKTGNEQDYLRNYTALDNIKSVTVKSLLSDEERKSLAHRKDEIAKQREEKARQEKEAKKLKEEQEQKQKAQLEANRLTSLSPLDLKIEELQKANLNMPLSTLLLKYLEDGSLNDFRQEALNKLIQEMKANKEWKENPTGKKPEKDKGYQKTLKVKRLMGIL
jgi:hypothetical protein